MLTKNQQLTLTCTTLGSNFQGICRHDGMAIFVPGLLPGEEGLCQLVQVKKHYAFAKLLTLTLKSPQRQESPCPYFPKCGGCSGQHMTYAATLTWKTQQVVDCFTRLGGFEDIAVAPILPMENPWYYRNKNALPIGGEAGRAEIGFYAPRSHRIIDIEECKISMSEANTVLEVLRRWMNRNLIAPYDEQNHQGLLRHVLTRVSQKREVMVILVSKSRAIPHIDELIAHLRAALPTLVSVGLSLQPKPTNVILSNQYELLWGQPRLKDTLHGHEFALSPLSFFQINPMQTEKLYQTALAFAGLTGQEEVADVYCGVGTITLMLAKHAKKVVGIEQVAPAIVDAKANAKANGITNVDFYEGDAEKVFPAIIQKGFRPQVVVVDPPRKGMDERVISALLAASPNKIVYISCDPATQARDAALLAKGGYAIAACQPVDMFCWTGSIENVLLMEKM